MGLWGLGIRVSGFRVTSTLTGVIVSLKYV